MATADLSPYGPHSLRRGAVVTYRGETWVRSGASIVEAIESGPVVGTCGASLLLPEVVVLHRGPVSIVPLSWEPVSADRDAPEGEALHQRAADLWTEIRSACEHRHGGALSIDLDPDTTEPYAIALRRSGVRRADWWLSGDAAVVLVVHGDQLPAPFTAMALQVTPLSWVADQAAGRGADRRRRPAVPGDLTWTWADVVDAAEQTPPTEGS